jgi:hypothetical protein
VLQRVIENDLLSIAIEMRVRYSWKRIKTFLALQFLGRSPLQLSGCFVLRPILEAAILCKVILEVSRYLFVSGCWT